LQNLTKQAEKEYQMKSIVKALKEKKILVSDGAWGTFLHKSGLEPGECPELWNITNREKVLNVAQSYIDAGADLILTNSFGGSPQKLKHYELAERTYELNKAAAEISREAAGDDKFVLGSVGPTGVMLMMGEVSEDELLEGFRVQIKGLCDGGIDAVCIETMSDLSEAVLAIKAAKEIPGLEVICTFTFEQTMSGDYKTMMGIAPEEMTAAIIRAGADIIGANCGNGFDQMVEIVSKIRNTDGNIPILVHANAGKPVYADGITIFPETPEEMSPKISKLIDAGANIIGGCCGTTPGHIKAIVKEVSRYR